MEYYWTHIKIERKITVIPVLCHLASPFRDIEMCVCGNMITAGVPSTYEVAKTILQMICTYVRTYEVLLLLAAFKNGPLRTI
eukprot:14540991-Ditylum_brightwellii.AAC.1